MVGFFPSVGFAGSIYVQPGQSIQAGINSCDPSAGYTEVVVADGTYYESEISLRGKAITVRSQSGKPSQCIVDGQQKKPTIFRLYSGETSSSVLSGLTIKNA